MQIFVEFAVELADIAERGGRGLIAGRSPG